MLINKGLKKAAEGQENAPVPRQPQILRTTLAGFLGPAHRLHSAQGRDLGGCHQYLSCLLLASCFRERACQLLSGISKNKCGGGGHCFLDHSVFYWKHTGLFCRITASTRRLKSQNVLGLSSFLTREVEIRVGAVPRAVKCTWAWTRDLNFETCLSKKRLMKSSSVCAGLGSSWDLLHVVHLSTPKVPQTWPRPCFLLSAEDQRM